MEGRPRLGLDRGGGEHGLLGGVQRTIRRRREEAPVALVVRGKDHALTVVLACEDDRSEASTDDVGVLQQVAALEIERVDVVGGEVRRIGWRGVALPPGLVFVRLEDLGRVDDVAAGLLVRGEEDPLSVRAEPRIGVVPAARGELVAFLRVADVEAEQLCVGIDRRRVDDRLAVRREDRRAVEEAVVGQVRDAPALDVVEIDVRVVVDDTGERDHLAVGRVARRELLLDVHRHRLDDRSCDRVDHQQIAAALVFDEQRDLVPRR